MATETKVQRLNRLVKEQQECEKQFYRNLIQFRKDKNISQTELSEMIAISQQTISKIETKGVNPHFPSLIIYLLALGIDINKIFE